LSTALQLWNTRGFAASAVGATISAAATTTNPGSALDIEREIERVQGLLDALD
jgi:hypothetical protein